MLGFAQDYSWTSDFITTLHWTLLFLLIHQDLLPVPGDSYLVYWPISAAWLKLIPLFLLRYYPLLVSVTIPVPSHSPSLVPTSLQSHLQASPLLPNKLELENPVLLKFLICIHSCTELTEIKILKIQYAWVRDCDSAFLVGPR